MTAVGVARLMPWPGRTAPEAVRCAYLAGPDAGGPPPLLAGCVGCFLPPTGAAHADVARMRRWLDAAAGAPARPLCIHRPEAVPADPRRHRLAVSFSHLCAVLGVRGALEVPPGPLPPGHPLADVLARWPALSVAVAAADAAAVAAAARAWGTRLAMAALPARDRAEALRAWEAAVPDASGWVACQQEGGAEAGW